MPQAKHSILKKARSSPLLHAPLLSPGWFGLSILPVCSRAIRASLRRRQQAVMDSSVLVVSREDMAAFSYGNPGVYMAIHDLQFVC